MKCIQIDLGKALCSDSAVDGVSKLVAKGFQITKACDLVVEQYSKKYPDEAPKSSKQLRKKYYDFQNADKPKKTRTVSEIPMVDNSTTTSCTECFALETKVAVLEQDAVRLQGVIKDLQGALDEVMYAQDKTVTSLPPKKTGKCPRSAAYDFIKEKGSALQAKALALDNLPNERMYNILSRVREEWLKHSPPQSLPDPILAATEVV